ncbi:putative Cytochrome P450 [Seiridium unicorne]|uniref:Cytochrome P450 n=1 Tax=Seiridium unicorne TaxID=138068 RepID=A0ABR2V195_9PEZI
MEWDFGFVQLCSAAILGALILKFYGFVTEIWKTRSMFRALREEGMPMPPHSAWLGHLLAAKQARDELPANAHSMYILNRMTEKYSRNGLFYLDTLPIMPPVLFVSDPYLANQAIQHSVVGSQKPHMLYGWFYPITGGHSLFTQNGEEWKHDHNLFLPFFSNSNLDAAVPMIVDHLKIYRDKLLDLAKAGSIFQLEPLTLALMNDIIGKLIFNADLRIQQTGSHPLADTMLRQLHLKFAANDVVDQLGQLNPVKIFNLWNNSRVLNNHIQAQLGKRIEVYRASDESRDSDSFDSVLDIALKGYLEEGTQQGRRDIDSDFVKRLCAQMRMFFFAGYDSTAAAMVYCCYMIWKHPTVLAKLRQEHDEVFGTNVAAAMDMIGESPALLNSLPYTTAVIKETTRLYPPASGLRDGCKDLVLVDRDGNRYPTEGCSVQLIHMSIHRNPDVWVRPHEFLPERFLVDAGHALYPPKGAWRVFEYGTRMCTGQAMVMKEIKAFMVLLAREFDIQECYDEIDEDRSTLDLSGVFGEKVYQVEAGAAHPRGNYPCRVSLSAYQAE